MQDLGQIDLLEAGRAAYARNAWTQAYGLFRDADASGELTARDLEALAKSAWWAVPRSRSPIGSARTRGTSTRAIGLARR